MFGNLQKLNKQNRQKNKSYQEAFNQRNLCHQKSKQQSYARLHQKRKQNKNGFNHHELIQSDQFIFEGLTTQEIKNGEGCMFMKNGHLVIGKWTQDVLNGRALIFTPFGGIITAQFLEGKLNGWAISLYQNKTISLTCYYENSIDTQRIMFQNQQSLWVASKYSGDGKFVKITHVEKGERNQLPYFIDSEELQQLYQEFVINRNFSLHFKTISHTIISKNTEFVGFLNGEGLPNGLGCLFSQEEMFVGMYHDGCLHHFGRMIFKNGEIYQGFIKDGAFNNEGIYYSPRKNQTSVILTSQDSQTQIIDEIRGYCLIDFYPRLGLKVSNNKPGLEFGGLKLETDQIDKLYSKWNIEKKMKYQKNYSVCENRSQQSKILDNDQNSPKAQKAPNIKKIWSLPKNKWIEGISGESEQNEDGQIYKQTHSITKWDRINYPQHQMHRQFAPDHQEGTHRMITFKSQNENDFISVPIKQNEEPTQRESFKKKYPQTTKSKPVIANFNASGTMTKQKEDGRLFQIIQVEQTQKKEEQKEQPEKVFIKDLPNVSQYSLQSSSISNYSQKVDGIIGKKSNRRKKIFQQN